MLAAYWHKNGIEIYRLLKGNILKTASGSLDRISPVKSFGKKVLIIGVDMLFHIRKKYPPASEKDVREAAQTEMQDISPVKNPAHFLRIFERSDNYVIADIWVWDSSEYDRLKTVFPFTHALPEAMAFVSEEPEISLMGGKDINYAVAHSPEGFVGAATFKGDITSRRIELFIKSLGRYSGTIKGLNLYGTVRAPQGLKELPLKIINKDLRPYPFCLDSLGSIDIKGFRVKSEHRYVPDFDIAARAAIYLIAAYSFSLFMTLKNFDSAIKETDGRISSLSKEIAAITQARQDGGSPAIINELGEKMRDNIPVLRIMDKLSERLPAKTFVSRISLSGKGVELLVLSKEPINVIRALGGPEGFNTVKLRGAPNKAPNGTYSFVLTIE